RSSFFPRRARSPILHAGRRSAPWISWRSRTRRPSCSPRSGQFSKSKGQGQRRVIMRRGEVMSIKRGQYGDEGELRRLTKREIDQRVASIIAEVARAFEDAEPERLEYLGEQIYPRPMDTKKFIRIMSRHLVFN